MYYVGLLLPALYDVVRLSHRLLSLLYKRPKKITFQQNQIIKSACIRWLQVLRGVVVTCSYCFSESRHGQALSNSVEGDMSG
jgi:hypothetical protein